MTEPVSERECKIREAMIEDAEGIRAVHLCAFPDEENEEVAELAVGILRHTSTPASLSLVACIGEAIVAHVAFTPMNKASSGELVGYNLAPVGVHPDHQKAGLGSKLIEYGIERMREQGVTILLVYGDPAYYGRFGFNAEIAEPFAPPHPLEFPFGWQGMFLSENPAFKAAALSCVPPLDQPELW